MGSYLRWAAVAFAAVGLVCVQGSRADAALILRLSTDNGANWTTIQDGSALDTSPVVGVVSFSDNIGGFDATLNVGTSKPIYPNSPVFAAMSLNSIEVSSVTGGTLLVQLTDTDFLPVDPGLFGGRADFLLLGGSVSLDAYKSGTNDEFEITNTDAHVDMGTYNSIPAIADIEIVPHGAIPTYSMTLVAEITHGAGIQFTQFQFDVQNVGPGQIPFMPEPGSMVVWGLGAGLIGAVGYFKRRRTVA